MSLQKFPGFTDIHVHLREPGATHKEDFSTGSRAAIKGGFTFIIDMPNNPLFTLTKARLSQKIKLSKKKAICDIGFYFGTNGENIPEFKHVWNNKQVFGLKLFLNHTTGEMLIEDIGKLEQIFKSWQSQKPILVHAEGVQLAAALALAHFYNRKLHVCHLSQDTEVELIKKAKAKKQAVTAGVTPHHLFMTEKDVLKMKGFAMVKPKLGTQKDQDSLWQGLQNGTIDLVETDHAPHTIEEKKADPPAHGITGLEAALGLLFLAVKNKKLKQKDVIRLLYDKPKEIFNIPNQPHTFIELDPQKPYIFGQDTFETKCNWYPYKDWQLYGKVEKVVLYGKTVLQNGKIIV
ncbi:amidohydrolase family protein [Candidatus Beckwithbacteria bacterium]|nr:amidohydrolase family protein [Candidatus Beckwithbacteria bacterium]